MDKNIDLGDIASFLYKEARFLDEEKWDEWIECYHPNCPFWMPSWDDDETLVTDPQKEISLIYYPDRQGLEDRVFRIKTERSSATIPMTRTSHNINNIEIIEQDGLNFKIRFNWHTLSFRYSATTHYFGFSVYNLNFEGDKPLITNKYVVLKNDYIHHLIDIYHI